MCGPALAATYYVRADGAAANKAAATSPEASGTSMSVATFNGEAFSDNDVVVFSSKGGLFTTTAAVIPSSGTSGNEIEYKGEPGYLPTFRTTGTTGFTVDEISHIVLRDLAVDGVNTTNNFLFSGAGTNIVTHNLSAFNSGNQCYQHLETVSVTHNNLYAENGSDDCISAHDSATVVVNRGLIREFLDGINWVGTPTITLNDVYVLSPRGSTANPFDPQEEGAATITARRCVFEEHVDSTESPAKYVQHASTYVLENCVFLNLTDGAYYWQITSDVASFKMYNCTFLGDGVNTCTCIYNQLSSAVFKNNIFVDCGTEAFYDATGTIDYNLFYNSGTARGTNTVTSDPSLDAHGWHGSGSSAIGAGVGPSVDGDVPTTDVDGNTRSGTTCDLGALEYTAFASPAWGTVDSLTYANLKLITVSRWDALRNIDNAMVTVKIVDDADMGAATNADGYDVRFTEDDGATLLEFDRVYHTVAVGELDAMYVVGMPLYWYQEIRFYVYYRSTDTSDAEDESTLYGAVGAVGVWHMQEGTGSTVADHSGNINDGALVGGDNWIAGGGLELDGSANYVSVAYAASLNLTGQVTMEVDIQPDGTGTMSIFGRIDYQYWLWRDGAIMHLRINSGADVATKTYQSGLVRERVGMTFDDAVNRVRWYLDGALYDTQDSITTDMASDTSNTLYMGVDPRSGSGIDWDGSLFSAYLYNRVLTPAELMWNYISRSESDGNLTWSAEEAQQQGGALDWWRRRRAI